MRRQSTIGKFTSPQLIWALFTIVLTMVLGYVLAGQIIAPNQRIIKASVGLALLTTAFLLPNRFAVAFLLFSIPFPQNTTIGSTTVIFAFIIFSFWLLKMALGYEKPPILTGLEPWLVALVLLYFISFVKVDPGEMKQAIAGFRTFISAVFIFYLVTNMVRTERDIQFVLNALILSFSVVATIALIELWLPGAADKLAFLKVSTRTVGKASGVRVGSVFGDYEMFAEYCAIFIPILLIRVISEKVFLRQLIWMPLLGVGIMLLIGTATRGAFLSMIIGLTYLVWISWRILDFQKFLPLVVVAAVAFYVFAITLDQYTESASLFGRLGKTKLVDGMPDTRARVWEEAWIRIEESPWIGHGPYYFTGVDERNVHSNYPHSLFLFLAHMIGIPGAVLFYGFLFAIIRRGYRAARAFATERNQFAYTVVILSSCMIIFLIDEFKISFLRYDQTQQFTWTMFALVLAASRVAMKHVEERKKQSSLIRSTRTA